MIIYKVTNLINGKIYIGQTVRSFERRKGQHIRNAFNYNSELVIHRALRKYGIDSFNWEVIDTALTQEELNQKEIYWIGHYSSFGKNGYNSTFGGGTTSGLKMSEESKKKMSAIHKGKIISEETRKKIGDAHRGKTTSDETKKKLSDLNKGSNHPRTKLTEKDVLQIKELIKIRLPINEIASKFNVKRIVITNIKCGRTWSNIGEDVSYIEYSKIQNSRLAEDDVREIKILLANGILTQKEIAEIYGVGKEAIRRIFKGDRWGHVEIA